MNTSNFKIISLKNRTLTVFGTLSKEMREKYQELNRIYFKTDDSGIIGELEQYLSDPQVKSFECEKKESHYILKPTYLKYQGEQLPNQIIKDTEKYGSKQEVYHREEKQIYYTPTYKKAKVAKTEGKNISTK